jgi:hypothetical protein
MGLGVDFLEVVVQLIAPRGQPIAKRVCFHDFSLRALAATLDFRELLSSAAHGAICRFELLHRGASLLLGALDLDAQGVGTLQRRLATLFGCGQFAT